MDVTHEFYLLSYVLRSSPHDVKSESENGTDRSTYHKKKCNVRTRIITSIILDYTISYTLGNREKNFSRFFVMLGNERLWSDGRRTVCADVPSSECNHVEIIGQDDYRGAAQERPSTAQQLTDVYILP